MKIVDQAPLKFNLNDLLCIDNNETKPTIDCLGTQRKINHLHEYQQLLSDNFSDANELCAFVRLPLNTNQSVSFNLRGEYTIESTLAGGWLIKPKDVSLALFWLPRLPILRQFDDHEHIIKESNTELVSFNVETNSLEITLQAPIDGFLDLICWKLNAGSALIAEFTTWSALELQPYFMWSSHTLYSRPADLYQHLVYGHIYENHSVWPNYWKICSELDAYALYVTLQGLKAATGKQLYDLLCHQIVISVIARQHDDGGWYHGEWTDDMESHFRLCSGALHLLAAAYEQGNDPLILSSMQKSAAFLASHTDNLDCGIWFSHDSLEDNQETIKKYPFRRINSNAFGKSQNNMLVLNTHLDTTLAMDRYQQVSGDIQYNDLIISAHQVTKVMLESRPAELAYKAISYAINLTLLPTAIASQLPLPIRALKRFTWKYLIPWLPRFKAHFPRFIMPNGFVERDLSQCSFSDQYISVNLMDIVRYKRNFPDIELPHFTQSFNFILNSGLIERWKESANNSHALGFWLETIIHLCALSPSITYRQWLLSAALAVEEVNIGFPPSVLGSHPEIARLDKPCSIPLPSNPDLRVIKLSGIEKTEVLIINHSNQAIHLEWDTDVGHAPHKYSWQLITEVTTTTIQQVTSIPGKSGFLGTCAFGTNKEI